MQVSIELLDESILDLRSKTARQLRNRKWFRHWLQNVSDSYVHNVFDGEYGLDLVIKVRSINRKVILCKRLTCQACCTTCVNDKAPHLIISGDLDEADFFYSKTTLRLFGILEEGHLGPQTGISYRFSRRDNALISFHGIPGNIKVKLAFSNL